MADVAKSLHAAVDQLCAAGGKVVLVLDQPDLWLATAGPGDGVTSGSLKDLVLDLREVGSIICYFVGAELFLLLRTVAYRSRDPS